MPCPLCHSAQTAPYGAGHDRLLETTTEAFQLTACHACDCLFIDPMPDEAALSAFYPDTYWDAGEHNMLSALEDRYRRLALRDHVSFIRQTAGCIPTNGGPLRLLDVGCGSGLLLDEARRHGFAVSGIDVSAGAARAAQSRSGAAVINGTIESAALESESFDIVTMFHCLEHLINPRRTLAEARRVLKPHGRLIVQAPNIRSWQSRLLGGRWHGLDIPRHTIDYSHQSMHRLLEACRFRPERVRFFNIRDNAPALASSIAPGLDPVRRRTLGLNGRRESFMLAWTGHLLYLGLVGISLPFALLEAAAGRGATIMIEARKA